MPKVFDAKIRRIGNSLGIIIPNDIIEEHGYHRGDVVPVAMPGSDIKTRNERIHELVGIYRGKSPFEREKGDRY